MGRCLLLVISTLGIIGVGTAPASAQTGCGPGYTETTVPEALTMFPGYETAIWSGDLDGDGILCYQDVPGVGPQFVDS